MTKTDAEWLDISVFIARKVMGWHVQEGIRAFPKWLDENFNDTGYSVRGPGFYSQGHPRWEPPFNIAQAMLALRTLLSKIGEYAVAKLIINEPRGYCRASIHNWVRTEDAPAMIAASRRTRTEAQAICLAIELWCKAGE